MSLSLLGAFGAAFLAGLVNSIAGGGSLISFPILMLLGLPPVVANATNTAGIWSGSVGSMWGFREELRRLPRQIFWLLIPSVVGGLFGAGVLRHTPAVVFARLVPWLIVMATLLFLLRERLQKRLRSVEAARHQGARWLTIALGIQLLLAIYGGFFGAGVSIMMLAVLGLLGMTDIFEMSATTSMLSCAINGVAGIYFTAAGLVAWNFVPVMAVGAVCGGFVAVGLARRVGKKAVRYFVIGVGLTTATVMFIRLL